MQSSHDPKADLEARLQRHLPELRDYVRQNMDASLARRESCADLVQSVCREVLQSRARFEYQGDAAFKSWLRRVALHKLMNRRRFYNASNRVDAAAPGPYSGWSTSDLARLAESVGTPSADAMLQEDLDRLVEALGALTEPEQRIIRWIHLEGVSHAEAAQRMGCAEARSRKRLSRALARLSGRLRELQRRPAASDSSGGSSAPAPAST